MNSLQLSTFIVRGAPDAVKRSNIATTRCPLKEKIAFDCRTNLAKVIN